MSRTLTGWSFWGTRGSRGTEAPARQPGTRVNPLQRAGPIRVRAEIPSVTRKRAFLNHAQILQQFEYANSLSRKVLRRFSVRNSGGLGV